MIYYMSAVFQTGSQGLDYDTPTMLVYTDSIGELDKLPFVEQLFHEEGTSEIVPIARGYSEIANHRDNSEPRDHRLAPVAVSDEWRRVMREEYDQRAKVIMLREPVTSQETVSTGLPVADAGSDLPAWLDALFRGEMHMAAQDVSVTDSFMSTIATAPRVYRSVDEWADTII